MMENKTCCFVVLTVWFGGCRQRTSNPCRTENATLKLCSSWSRTVIMDLSDAKQMTAGHWLSCLSILTSIYFIHWSLIFCRNSGHLTWVRPWYNCNGWRGVTHQVTYLLTWVSYSSCKSGATHSYQCVYYFPVSKQWYGCQCLGFLMSTQMWMHALPNRGCMDTIRVCAESRPWMKKSLPTPGGQTDVSLGGRQWIFLYVTEQVLSFHSNTAGMYRTAVGEHIISLAHLWEFAVWLETIQQCDKNVIGKCPFNMLMLERNND